MLITCDGARSTHTLVEQISALTSKPVAQAHDAVGFDVDERVGAVLTGLLHHSVADDRLTGWPPDMQIITRRENPHPGAQLSLFE